MNFIAVMSEFYALEFALCHKFGHREKFTEIAISVRVIGLRRLQAR